MKQMKQASSTNKTYNGKGGSQKRGSVIKHKDSGALKAKPATGPKPNFKPPKK